MDYAYIIKSIRELKALVKSILDQDQQAILQFHQSQLIDMKNPNKHYLKYDIQPQISIPNEKWSQRSVVEFEEQINKILKQSENRWHPSNENVSNISDFALYQVS